MMCYMDENQLQTDIFYIMLCSDLKVVLDSLGRRNAELYITSRLTSQGRQETYTCDPDANEAYIEEDINELDLDLDLNLEDGRYNRMTLQINSNSNNLKSPYATPQQVGLMRGISSRPMPKEFDFDLSESDEDEDEDEDEDKDKEEDNL